MFGLNELWALWERDRVLTRMCRCDRTAVAFVCLFSQQCCFVFLMLYVQYQHLDIIHKSFHFAQISPACFPHIYSIYMQVKWKGSRNQALCRWRQEACHFPVYSENVRMSVPPAASGEHKSLFHWRPSKGKSSSCPILVNTTCVCLFFTGAAVCTWMPVCAFKFYFPAPVKERSWEAKWPCFRIVREAKQRGEIPNSNSGSAAGIQVL